MDNNMHGTTTTRIINQPHETSPPSFRQFRKGRRGEMVRRATPAPALDKNHHPLHVFPLAAAIRRQLLLCSFRRATGDIRS